MNNKTIAALLTCVAVLLVLVIPAVFMVKQLVQESYSFFVLIKEALQGGIFSSCENSLCQSISRLWSNPQVQVQAQETIKGATAWIVEKGSAFLVSIPRMILNLFLIFFTMFYFLKEGEGLLASIQRYLHRQHRSYSYILSRFKEITSGIVYGYLLIALIQGALGALGFFLFGISSPLFWGLLMGILSLLPMVGTGLIWVPAALILLLNGIFQDSYSLIFKGIGLFLYGLLIVSSLDNILRPKLISEKVKIHSAVILLGILGGVYLFGPLGVIVGPLIFSMTLVLLKAYFNSKKA